MEKLIKGEKDLFEIELEGLVGSYLSDDGVNCFLKFYTKGKRDAGEVVIDALYPAEDGDTNKMYAVVDTSTLPEGELVCEGTIEYPNPLVTEQLTGKAYTTTDCEITVNR